MTKDNPINKAARAVRRGAAVAGETIVEDFERQLAEDLHPAAAGLAPLTKWWWQSRGVVGPLVAILAVGGGWLGVDVDAATQGYLVDQTVAGLTALGVLAGAVTGIVGRLRATRAIR